MPVNFEYWTQTSVLCRAYGARLVVIDSAAKHSLVQSYLASKTGGTSTQQVWIGKTNTFGEGLGDGGWIDVTVGPTPYIDWATGFPLSTDKTNCMYITNGSPDYKMKNDQCLKSFKAVCEYAYDGTGTL
ncbi:hypothetical protein MAR_009786 [Mya arenaria]|uniref:C-type lectin domain-containing protein n=1 Tax=Mya arenaria TaxID=6604 RepID=A0ABY7DZU5_MYAAR|nr:hypothetical protein MAR_009786 [Mya arenaria]